MFGTILLCCTLTCLLGTQRCVAETLEPGTRWSAVGDQVGRLLSTTPNPAAALIIVENGAVALRRDYTKISNTQPSATVGDTPFRLGSITKTFTALALLHAAAATDTPLDTPLYKIIDKSLWENRWRSTHPVRLHQLIELSAGFQDISQREFASARPLPREDALALDAASHATHWPPGLQHSYTNLSPVYSALAIEALTGTPFETYLQNHVFTPLNMPHATLQPVPGLPGGFRADGTTPIPYWHTIFPSFGGLNATPNEFARFLIRLTRNDFGAALNSALKRRGAVPLWQPVSTAAALAGLPFGYGAGIYSSLRNGHLVFGHGGDADGYRSRYGVVANSDRGYFIAINSDNPKLLRRMRGIVERALIANLPAPAPAAEHVSLPPHSRLQQFIGDYYPASQRFGSIARNPGNDKTVRIEIVNDRLQLRRGRTVTEMIWLGDNQFRRQSDPVATLVFTRFENTLYLHGELGNWQRHAKLSP